MEPLQRIESRTVVLLRENIDTDQVIPARFLKGTVKTGLGRALFADWRYDAAGVPRPGFPLNAPSAAGCRILVTGDNFGCGSSREHAPWALVDHGFRAVVSTSIADIFKGNALKNGLLPVVVDRETHAHLLATPGARVTIDVAEQTLAVEGGVVTTFPLDRFSRLCLLRGTDELGWLLAQDEAITAWEVTR